MNSTHSPVQAATDLPVDIPPGHVGPIVLPGTGRQIYWTGRVAIGLRHVPDHGAEPIGSSALWIQDLVLNSPLPRF